MKKIPIYIFIVIILVELFSPTFSIHASKDNPNERCDTGKPPTNLPCVQPYALLEPLPGMDNTKDPFYPSEPGALGTYLNIAIKIFIGLCAVLAVVMIVIGGIEYSTSELVSSKAAGKDRIRDALLGLLLALGAYLILFTINPDLLNTEVGVDPAILTTEVHEFIIQNIIQVGETPVGNKARNRGTACDANVVFQAAQDTGNNISKSEAAALSCIGGKESRGCQAIPADPQAGVSSGGFGQFQIVLSLHGGYAFNNSVCKQVAGVDQNQSLICKDRNSTACQKATSDLRCQAAATAKIFLNGKARGDYYGDWFRTQGPCANAQCVHELDPSVNLHIPVRGVPGRLSPIPDLAQRCGIR